MLHPNVATIFLALSICSLVILGSALPPKIAINGQKPEISLQKPENSQQNPENSQQNPENSQQKPEISLQKPENSQQKNPENSLQNPENSQQNPENSRQNPEKSLQNPEKRDALRQWLKEDMISIDQFDQLFGSPQEIEPNFEPNSIYGPIFGPVGPNFLQKGGKQFETAVKKPNNYKYNDTIVRQKFLPMAAAAYGNQEAIASCLRNTFEEAELYQNLFVNCEGKEGQLCSGFVALLHSEKAILLSFRGTDSTRQLWHETYDLVFKSPSDGIHLSGKVGSYYLRIFHQLQANVEAALELSKKYADYEIWLTGHSLGGSLASLAAANIYAKEVIAPEKIRLITLGQPRTGDLQWAKAMDEALPFFNYRVVNHQDPIPHMPARLGYMHFMTEIWYNSGMEQNADFVECATANEDNQKCSNSLRWYKRFYNFNDHREYFGKNVNLHGSEGCPLSP